MNEGTCDKIYINVTHPEDAGWLIGKTWGARLWESGTDRGGHFLIKKEPIPHDPLPVGPNLVLNPPTSSEEKVAPIIIVTPSPDSLSKKKKKKNQKQKN